MLQVRQPGGPGIVLFGFSIIIGIATFITLMHFSSGWDIAFAWKIIITILGSLFASMVAYFGRVIPIFAILASMAKKIK